MATQPRVTTPSSEESHEKKGHLTEPTLFADEAGLQGQKRRQPSNTAFAEDSTLAVLDLVKEQDVHHPMHWGSWKRWSIAFFYCTLQAFVTLTSTTYVSAEYNIGLDFGGTDQTLTLGQSMFILGTAVGPAFLGPLADIGGRKWVYVVSIALYAILNVVCIICLTRVYF